MRLCKDMKFIYFSENFRNWNEKLKSGGSWGEFMRLCNEMKFIYFSENFRNWNEKLKSGES